MKRLVLLLGFGLLAAACTHYSKVEPKRTEIGDGYSVEPQIAWNKTRNGDGILWTVDGPLLQALYLYGGLESGDKLFRVDKYDEAAKKSKQEFPTFDPAMQASEVMEFVVDSLVQSGLVDVRTSQLRPADFGPLPGFRFDMTMRSKEGLEIDGMAIGNVSNFRLHLIIYIGAQSHYFPKYRDDVEKIISSIRLET